MNEIQRKVVDWWIIWSAANLTMVADETEFVVDLFIAERQKPSKQMARDWLSRMLANSQDTEMSTKLSALNNKDDLEKIVYKLRDPNIYTIKYNEKSLRDSNLYNVLVKFLSILRSDTPLSDYVTTGENSVWSKSLAPYAADLFSSEVEGVERLEGIKVDLNDAEFAEVLDAIKNEANVEFPNGVTQKTMAMGPLLFKVIGAENLVVEFEIRDEELLEHVLSFSESEEVADNIVYEYEGTNDTIGGASAQGMYVAELRPDQLPKEGADLGICVGRKDMHYIKNVEEGKTKIYSIRTSAGKPKLCIEFTVATKDIPQIRGTANRVPGFNKYLTMSDAPPTDKVSVDELRLAVEFLRKYLKLTPSRIHHVKDLVPAIRAAEDADIDVFSPPSKQNAPEQIAASARSIHAAMLIANSNPWAESTSLDAETRQKVVASLHAAVAVLSEKSSKALDFSSPVATMPRMKKKSARKVRGNVPLSFAEAKDAMAETAQKSAAEGIPVALGGGFAMQAYGSDRLTQDVDLIAPKLPSFAEDGELLSFGGKSVDVNGIPVDIIVRDDDYADLYEEAIQKAKPRPGYDVKLITPEYLVAMKMVAGRPKDDLDLNFLLSSVKMDMTTLKSVVSRFLGRYAVSDLASRIQEAKWMKKAGKL